MSQRFITVSIEIMHDKKLTPNQKFILAEIEHLSSLYKGCIATNKHFSDLIGITVQGVSRALQQLEINGYIKIDNSSTKRNFGRVITINHSLYTTINHSLESKENKQYNAPKETFEAFENLWKDYTLTFLKRKNRQGGSKKKAKDGYISLSKKYSYEEIYSFVENHALQKIGHKDLERLLKLDLIKQYFEDNK